MTTSQLLNELAMDSNERAEKPRLPSPIWLCGVLAFVLALAAYAAWTHAPIDRGESAVVSPITSPPPAPREPNRVGPILEASGYVLARRQASISPYQSGLLQRIHVDVGDHVREGQLLAEMDNELQVTAIMLAKARLEVTKANALEAELKELETAAHWQRSQALAEKALISEREYELADMEWRRATLQRSRAQAEVVVAEHELSLAQQHLVRTEIRAPFAGVIVAKQRQLGELISSAGIGGESVFCELANVDSIEVEVDLNENAIDKIKVGQPAEIQLSAYPDWVIAARVKEILPTAERTKGTVKVYLSFEDASSRSDPRLRLNTSVKISFLPYDLSEG